MRACRRVGRRPLGAEESRPQVGRPYIRPNFAPPVPHNETSGGPSKRAANAARTGACGRVGSLVNDTAETEIEALSLRDALPGRTSRGPCAITKHRADHRRELPMQHAQAHAGV